MYNISNINPRLRHISLLWGVVYLFGSTALLEIEVFGLVFQLHTRRNGMLHCFSMRTFNQ